MIELKCTNCGGKVSVAEDKVAAIDNAVIVRHGSTLKCNYCRAEFNAGMELPVSTVNIAVSQNIDTVEAGSTVVGLKIDRL